MNKNHSPFSIHRLNPGLVREVNNAYDRNVEAGRVVSNEFVDDVAKNGLGDLLRHEVAESASTEIHTGLDVIKYPDVRTAFEDAFDDTDILFDRIDLMVPTPEQFVEGGVNIEWLASRYEWMARRGQQPQIVIAPYLSYSYSSSHQWVDLYKNLKSVPNSPLQYSDSGNGLSIYSEVEAEWEILDDAPDDTARTQPLVAIPEDYHSTPWSIRLVPLVATPNAAHDDNSNPTIAEYLTLQALRIQNGEEPLNDSDMHTWLEGTYFDDGTRLCGVAGRWDKSLGEVVITSFTHPDIKRDETMSRQTIG